MTPNRTSDNSSKSFTATVTRIARNAGVLLVLGGCLAAVSSAASRVGPESRSTSAAQAPAAAKRELLHSVARPVDPKTRQVMMEVTAYCPCKKCCGPNAAGITASGKLISYNAGRFVAADTAHLPFGTKLVIPGYSSETAPVEVIDRGGAIKGQKLDVFFPTHEEALQWGRQRVSVTVVE